MTALGHARHARRRARARPGARLVRPRAHRRPDDPVPHLPLPADSAPTTPTSGASASTPTTACSRSSARTTSAGSRCDRPRRLDRRAARCRRVRVQHRRHARAHDRRPLPLDAAPGPQHRAPTTGCRSRSSSTRAGTPRCDRFPRSRERPRATRRRATRWDGASVHELTGTYGDYLLSKVSKVFPALKSDVL